MIAESEWLSGGTAMRGILQADWLAV